MAQVIFLENCTFLIPTKIDSEDRKINLTLVVDYLLKHFKTNIIIAEQDTESKVKSFFKWGSKVKHIFVPSTNDFFHKTRLLNIMIKDATTDVVVSYDSDIILPLNQYLDTFALLNSKQIHFAYPFNSRVYHIEKAQRGMFEKNLSLDDVGSHTTMKHPGVPPGGVLFMNKAEFAKCGYENENFKSWGAEDIERTVRIEKFGYAVARMNGLIFHLEHDRTPHSTDANPHYKENEVEFKKTVAMSKEELENYIKSWQF